MITTQERITPWLAGELDTLHDEVRHLRDHIGQVVSDLQCAEDDPDTAAGTAEALEPQLAEHQAHLSALEELLDDAQHPVR